MLFLSPFVYTYCRCFCCVLNASCLFMSYVVLFGLVCVCLDTVRVILGVPLLSSCFLHYGLHHLLCILVSVHRLYV